MGILNLFHDLRRTFDIILSSGMDVKTMSSMLSHYNARFALDTYTYIINDMQRGVEEKIGGVTETATTKPKAEQTDSLEQS